MPTKKKTAHTKPAAPKTTATKTATASTVDPDAAVYTLADVATRAGAPSADDRDTWGVDEPADALAELGSRIRSERILTDATRWAGQLLDWTARDPARADGVVGYDAGLLRVLVAEAARLRDLVDAHDHQRTATDGDHAVNQAHAAATYEAGARRREQLLALFKVAARFDAALAERVESAKGASNGYATLATSLEALADVGASLLSPSTSKLARQLAKGRADAAYFAGVKSLAADVRAAGAKVTGARVATKVTQGDLDRQDGVCLVLMEQLHALFAAAHDEDATVPNLVPIATRRLFGAHVTTKKATTTPSATPPAKTVAATTTA